MSGGTGAGETPQSQIADASSIIRKKLGLFCSMLIGLSGPFADVRLDMLAREWMQKPTADELPLVLFAIEC